MNELMYLACDFSGIQRYVLGVKNTGKAQAKRLRARSFLLELFEYATLWTIRERLKVAEEDVLIHGGGGFMVQIPHDSDSGELEKIRSDIQRKLWDETAGEVQVSLSWGETPLVARSFLEVQKRRTGVFLLQENGYWSAENWSQPHLDKPCEICRQSPGWQNIQNEDGNVLYCRSCWKAQKLGERLTRWEWMRPGNGTVEALGVKFEPLKDCLPGSFHVGRWIPRHSDSGEPLTFQEISERACGDRRLAVMKADVDSMGARVSEIALEDPSYRRLRSFSHCLHEFFGQKIQKLLRDSWKLIYTLYAGGDDLLLVGPWNVILDFAGALAVEFEKGPGHKYSPLTFSAGIAVVSYRLPIYHAVEEAEKLLESAKSHQDKNRCAALGSDWEWTRHESLIQDGKNLATWVADGVASRSLLHRLLSIAESKPSGENPRTARWAYQIERNVQQRHSDFRSWALNEAIEQLESDNKQQLDELSACLRYALLATRSAGEEI